MIANLKAVKKAELAGLLSDIGKKEERRAHSKAHAEKLRFRTFMLDKKLLMANPVAFAMFKNLNNLEYFGKDGLRYYASDGYYKFSFHKVDELVFTFLDMLGID